MQKLEMGNINEKERDSSPLVLQVIILEKSLASARRLIMTESGSRKSMIE
jgi:hypothetical protein